jgi:hypothetical protein
VGWSQKVAQAYHYLSICYEQVIHDGIDCIVIHVLIIGSNIQRMQACSIGNFFIEISFGRVMMMETFWNDFLKERNYRACTSCGVVRGQKLLWNDVDKKDVHVNMNLRALEWKGIS